MSATVRGFVWEYFITWYVFTVRSCQHLAHQPRPPPPPNWGTTPCRVSATAYSIYSQLPSMLEAIPPSANWGRAMPWWHGLTYREWNRLPVSKISKCQYYEILERMHARKDLKHTLRRVEENRWKSLREETVQQRDHHCSVAGNLWMPKLVESVNCSVSRGRSTRFKYSPTDGNVKLHIFISTCDSCCWGVLPRQQEDWRDSLTLSRRNRGIEALDTQYLYYVTQLRNTRLYGEKKEKIVRCL